MLRIAHPATFSHERNWIFQFVFGDVLGIEYTAQAGDIAATQLQLNGKYLTLADVFFSAHVDDWGRKFTAPGLPLKFWPYQIVADTPTPVLFGSDQQRQDDNGLSLGIDIFGAAFFMLSRYEEIVNPVRDSHDRFPASASFAQQAGYLERPIVDEYIEILWASMQTVWPNLQRKQHSGKINVTCDVDHPYDASAKSLATTLRATAADVIKRRNPTLARKRALNFVFSRQGDYRFDPFNNFDWYMDACEQNGHRATFYFIAGHSGGAIDGCYTLDERYIQRLLHRISQRGHEIGVHGSYNTWRDAAQVARERQALISSCEKAGADASVRSNRQHYLRWSTLDTPDVLDAAGYDYDSSGSFADRAGFRNGTARKFHMWSWQKNKPLRLQQKPLIMMESSVIAERYLGLGYSEATLKHMQMLKHRSLQYGGDFTMLWHNSHISSPKDKFLFKKLIGTNEAQ